MNEPDDELDVLIRHAEATQTGWKMVHASDLRTIHAKRASLTARLARVEAENKRLREALTWIAAQSCRRDAPCFELNACITERCETCYARAALKEGS